MRITEQVHSVVVNERTLTCNIRYVCLLPTTGTDTEKMMHCVNDTNLANFSIHFPGVELRLRTDPPVNFL